jgi:outer membrane protein
MKFLSNFVFLLILLPAVSQGQKLGYVNSQEILSKMTEVKIANIQLESYEKELAAKGEQMVLLFENQYKLYMNDVNAGILSKVQMAQKEEELIKKQEEIKNYESEMEMLLEKKQAELFEPIMSKIKDEINKIGKEGNYSMILDSSQGLLLHATETENLAPLLKTKLSIPE